ncbi:phage tail assembly chaperone [Alcaligenes aquatilis]|uniref:phage tail assembly chaperone n=1 Tax=Alcaligenes aquatilis TaxID=323284 RepID=UPI0038738716
MARPVEVTVNDTIFLITPMDAFEALEVFGDLQKDLLPAVGELLSLSLGAQAEQAEVLMSGAIEKLSEKLSGRQLKQWTDRLINADSVAVSMNGRDMRLDAAARAMVFKEFTDILELLFHVLKVNFASPLGRWLSRSGLDLSQLSANPLGAISQNSKESS